MAGRVNVGLIGAGRIGRVHARTLVHHVPEAHLACVADSDVAAARACAAEFHIPNAWGDHRAVIEDPAVQAVIICSSTSTHAPFIAECAAAGKDVFCEKPLALDLGEIDSTLAVVERHGVKLQIGFNRRFDPSFARARQMIAQGQIGVPHVVRITSRDPAPPSLEYVRVSGGLFLDMTIHDFDMARFLIGDEVAEVYAMGGVLVDPALATAADVDTAVVSLRYCGGAMAAIDNSRRAVYGYDQRLEVFGSEGVIVVGNREADSVVYSDAQASRASLPVFALLDRYAVSFVAEMQAFISAIRDDRIPPVTGRDGRESVVIGLAARRSHRENRPVKLEEIAPRSPS